MFHNHQFLFSAKLVEIIGFCKKRVRIISTSLEFVLNFGQFIKKHYLYAYCFIGFSYFCDRNIQQKQIT